MTILEISNVSKHFGGLKALESCSTSIDEGSIHSIIGPNGAGKTTLFNCVTGLGPATSGEIAFLGRTITREKPHRITPMGLARTFQNIRLFGEMTVLENVVVGMHAHLRSGVLGAVADLPSTRREEVNAGREAERLIEFVGLDVSPTQWARNLSYGDQRRLEIARAMAARPRLLLLDEPAAGMNPQETIRLMQLVRDIRDASVTVLLIEHDMKVVMGISDRVSVLDHGLKIAEGTPEQVRTNSKVIEAYLGRDEEAA
jgi:branched-chain amino acid transport system ATP-binding protein